MVDRVPAFHACMKSMIYVCRARRSDVNAHGIRLTDNDTGLLCLHLKDGKRRGMGTEREAEYWRTSAYLEV